MAAWCRAARRTNSIEAPCDLYVAGKIGSPHMNMIKGKLATDDAALESAIGPLPFACKSCKTAEAGEAAVIGIRPSDIRFAGKGEQGLKAEHCHA